MAPLHEAWSQFSAASLWWPTAHPLWNSRSPPHSLTPAASAARMRRKTMFFYLLILFMAVPIVELALLIRIGRAISEIGRASCRERV